ncbi:MAG: hypothetical protein K5666_00730, partial [Bacilli bacterium]|nr:hypothetical protein [Bacilli bacterium]
MNKRLIVKQEEISDCGVCCLLSIIRYYHGNISLEELRISSLTTREGVTALNLINCAIKYGFDAIGKRVDEIPIDKLPCIAHVRINDSLSHFIVIYSVNKNKVLLMDPSTGMKEITLDSFYKISTNVYILLKPKGIIKYQLNPQFIKKEYINLLLTNKKMIFKIILLNY